MHIVKIFKKIITCFFLILFSFFPVDAFPEKEEKEWFPFYIPWNYCKKSIIDVSYLLDAPAGKHGFLTVKNGHFYFQDGSRMRFWGLNIHSHNAGFPTHSQAEDIAKRLAQLGCNIVRMHFLDNEAPGGIIDGGYNDSQHFSDSQVEKLDYFIYQLKQNGIYVCFDVLGLGARIFKLGDDVVQCGMIKRYFTMAVSYFDKRIIELSKKFALDFLSHVNPYTGNAYINEPCIAIVEMTNENTMFLKSLCEGLPPYYKKEIKGMWRQWLLKKGRDLKDVNIQWYEDGEFLFEVQGEYQKDMYKYLRSIGVKVPIGSSNLPYNNLNLAVDSNMDFIDMHAYWDISDTLDRLHNRPLVMQSSLNPATIINKVSSAKVYQKPLISTEWGSLWPNDWRAVDVLATASYARLNDWDGLFLYAYNGGWDMSWDNLLEKKLYYGSVIFNDPAKMGLFPVASLIFLRGDVHEAMNKYRVSYNIDKLFDMKNSYEDKLKTAGVSYVSKLEKDFYKTLDRPNSGETSYPYLKEVAKKNKKVLSDTGELISDYEKGIFILKSPKTFSFAGFLDKEKQCESNGIEFSIASDFATVTATSLDGKKLRNSKHILITIVGRVRNKGQKLAPHLTKKPDDLVRDVYILNKGTEPILVEPIEGNVSIKRNRSRGSIRVFSLNEFGLRESEVPVDVDANKFSFSIPTKHRTIYYEIVKE